MFVVFTSTQAKREIMGGIAYDTMIIDFDDAKRIPVEVTEFANLKAVLEGFAAYKAKAIASGMGLNISLYQHGRCKARKFPGFDKARSAASCFVNLDPVEDKALADA